MNIRRLTPDDADAFQQLRLAALQDQPSAFGSSYEEEKIFTRAAIEARLALKVDRGPFGAFQESEMIGLIAVGRENMRKLAHKALIWGLYVVPEERGKGVGRALLTQALTLIRSVPDVLQVNLSVNAQNVNAMALYESMGFQRFGYEPRAVLVDGQAHDEVHMRLDLQAEGRLLAA